MILRDAVRGAVFCSLLFWAAASDLNKRQIPDAVCLGIVLAALPGVQLWNLAGVLSALPLLAAALCREGSVGGGDVKLMAASGLFLGFSQGILALAAALCLELLFAAAHALIRKIQRRTAPRAYPFAPFLALSGTGAFFAVLTL